MRVIDVDSHYFEPPGWLASVDPELAARLPEQDTVENIVRFVVGPTGAPDPLWFTARLGHVFADALERLGPVAASRDSREGGAAAEAPEDPNA